MDRATEPHYNFEADPSLNEIVAQRERVRSTTCPSCTVNSGRKRSPSRIFLPRCMNGVVTSE